MYKYIVSDGQFHMFMNTIKRAFKELEIRKKSDCGWSNDEKDRLKKWVDDLFYEKGGGNFDAKIKVDFDSKSDSKEKRKTLEFILALPWSEKDLAVFGPFVDFHITYEQNGYKDHRVADLIGLLRDSKRELKMAGQLKAGIGVILYRIEYLRLMKRFKKLEAKEDINLAWASGQYLKLKKMVVYTPETVSDIMQDLKQE